MAEAVNANEGESAPSLRPAWGCRRGRWRSSCKRSRQGAATRSGYRDSLGVQACLGDRISVISHLQMRFGEGKMALEEPMLPLSA